MKFKLYFLSLFILIFTCVSITAQTSVNTQFKLSGKHSFEKKGAKNWIVSQESIDEKSGESVLKENFAESKGEKAKFYLPKIKDKETIYHITANGNDFTEKYFVRVFEADKLSSFLYKTEDNPAVRTFIFVPKSLSANTRVLLVMHGLSRTAESYIQSWEDWAKKNDYIAVAPLFDNENWNGARKYNLGNLLTSKNLKIRQSKWSFQIVEDLHKLAKSGFGLKKDYFDIFGHSAGGQFVHRFMFFMPKANVRLAIAANPGWYTLPDLNTDFPYGLNNEKFSYTKDDVTNWTKRNVFLLRGTDDLERTENLTQTPEADAQGKNRFERAGFMFEKIKAINPNTNWRLIDVPKVVHDQKRMAVAAQMVLDLINKENKN